MGLIQDHAEIWAFRPGMLEDLLESARVLHTFHWFGLLWLAVGLLALAGWHGFRSLAWRSALSLLGAAILLALAAPVRLKYEVLLLPLALVPGFIWAARWKTSFVLVTLFLLGGLRLQTLGWLEVQGGPHPWLPVSIVTLDALSDGVADGTGWFHSFPMADGPGSEPWLWEEIPAGIQASLLFQDLDIDLEGGSVPFRLFNVPQMECLAMYLSLRGRLVEPGLLTEGDRVLIVSRFPFNLAPEPPGGRLVLSAPDHFQRRDKMSPYPLYVQSREVLSTRREAGSVRVSRPSGKQKGVD